MEEIWDRTKQAREGLGIDAKEMPAKFKALGIEMTTDAYYKYESRSPLKQHLITPFCKITGVNEKWLLSGEGDMNANSTQILSKEQRLVELLKQSAGLMPEEDPHKAFLNAIIQQKEKEKK